MLINGRFKYYQKKKDAEAEQKPKKPGEPKRSVFLNISNSNVFGGL
jgi:hypothetical protein